jgi:hypothetical protein
MDGVPRRRRWKLLPPLPPQQQLLHSPLLRLRLPATNRAQRCRRRTKSRKKSRSRSRRPAWCLRRTSQRAPSGRSQLLSRGGCQNRQHSLANCVHGDSIVRRFDSPSPLRSPEHAPRSMPVTQPDRQAVTKPGGDTDETNNAKAMAAPSRPPPQTKASRAFPCDTRSILTKVYLCHACSCHAIEDEHARAGGPGGPGAPVARRERANHGDLSYPVHHD